jgi:lipopolysaccharide/colanic/teichoic acid biosynthesis glycosyltransferase
VLLGEQPEGGSGAEFTESANVIDLDNVARARAVPVGAGTEADGSLSTGDPTSVVRLPAQRDASGTTEAARDDRPPPRRSIEAARLAAAGAVAPPRSRAYERSKRALDVIICLLVLPVAVPVMLVIALIVRLDSPGSPVFRQTRVGRGGRGFTFYKFRTMYSDARERFPDLYAYDYDDDDIPTLFFKLPYDPRCTRVGRRLRRTSLDELPNLINVLRGDMSLVGPRPEIPEMLPFYQPEELCKFAVRPGLTGLAQASGRNILRFTQTNAKDIEYVHGRSFALDLKILAITVWVVVLMLGAH